MKSKIFLLCVAVIMLLSAYACFPALKQVLITVSCDEFYENHHVRSEVQVGVGDTITIDLCSNPTTGFQWSEQAQIGDEAVVQQTDHKFVPPEGDVPGAPGEEIWTFEAIKEGSTTISMEYSRPWEGGEKGEWTFALTVTVK